MNNQEILDNASDSSFTAVHNTYSDEWYYTNQRNVRSLEDIKRIAELEDREKQLLQVIYNVSKVSFEAGACYQKSDFHNEAIKFAKLMQAKQLKEQG